MFIDTLHRPDHEEDNSVFYDPQCVKENKDERFNSEIQEQKNVTNKKYGHFISSISSDKQVKFLLYVTTIGNIEVNENKISKMQKAWN